MDSASRPLVMESHTEAVVITSKAHPQSARARRRRHSSLHSIACHADSDELQLLIDKFLVELSTRLDLLDSYGQIHLDSGIESAWNTLHVVRDSCSRVSGEVLDVGRRKAKVLVDVLEDSCNEAMARKDTLEQKVQEGVRLMESLLSDFEGRAHDLKENGIDSAYYLIDEGRKKVDEGLEIAKEVVDEGLDIARRAAGSIELAIETALRKAGEQGLLKIYDIPEPWKINHNIINGYRFHSSLSDCLRSALTLSNELFNIWSHAIGFIIVLFLAFYLYPSSDYFNLSTNTDVFIAGVFFFAACKCLICSTIWHTFNSIAEQHLIERFACVDYTGISVLIAASIMTTEYTAFYCEPSYRWFWMSTTAVFGLAGTILPWNPTFNRADMAWARVLFYVGLAATGCFPVAQITYTRGWDWVIVFYSPIIKSLAVYLAGAILYALQIPERWFPGVFDYVGWSHNIWHVAVLAGILFHYFAMQEFFAKAFLRAFMNCSVY